MIAIAVDDEILMLKALAKAISASPDVSDVIEFQSCTAVLEWLGENYADVAFLDISMRGMGGLALAKKITEMQPRCKIVFCTGFSEYALDAIQLRCSGYLIKPITEEMVQRELDYIKSEIKDVSLKIRCFGNFDVFVYDQELVFKRIKTKELFAYLVDRKGAGVNTKEICAVLWEDDSDKKQNYVRQLILDLRNSLRMAGASQVLKYANNNYYLDVNKVDCDYYSYLNTGNPKFYGEYMTQYSWAESTCAMLMNNYF